MAEPRLLRCGWHAVLVEFDGLEQVLALADAVRAAVAAGEHGFPEVIDVVPAATTVLVIVRDGGDIASLRPALARLAATASAATGRSGDGDEETVEIGVHYDGPDLDPRSSPGGWQLLGHTDAVIWDLEREPPALLRPGTTVRFVELEP
jgi:allophanate hydrolase subunit 1